ncbi:MAG: hypothetical protein E5Y63_17990 [Mesorhizobium sp.]|uniref:hypothetical protein n=1 Tax=Mesorhizobium sp. TaxID=1871066 RepID=UPI000FE74935|nr:hypothetical protein [Mesorhizobium sp.]RWP42492.1 MAG: hypothetical protein EOR04_11860 [Mesorhizobium sp.]RWP66806.1 MAG: hypothetical protein EOR08_01495 [Mesorhizobium sp.]TIM28950.1 MAG: hypothetical protein E5Y63_17990 [Mesorhizobium sp.]
MRILSTVAIASLVTVGSADAADRMAGDGLGCKDRAIAGRLIDMPDTDPAYIEIWAKGMQDLSCRGLGVGLEVAVKDRDDAMTCVRPLEDQTLDDGACFWVVNRIAPPE